MILALFAFRKSYDIFLAQNLGHNHQIKKCKLFTFGNWLSEKQLFTFGFFWTLKILLNPPTVQWALWFLCIWHRNQIYFLYTSNMFFSTACLQNIATGCQWKSVRQDNAYCTLPRYAHSLSPFLSLSVITSQMTLFHFHVWLFLFTVRQHQQWLFNCSSRTRCWAIR